MHKTSKMQIVMQAALFLTLVSYCIAEENRWSCNGPYEANVHTLAIDPRDNQRIFAGTIENGLYLTVDGGESWTRIEDDTLDNTIYDIEFHPFGPDTIYIASFKGMFRSFDRGVSWGLLRPPNYWYNTINDIEVNSVHPEIVIAGTGLDTGYRSTDGGNTWAYLNLPWIAVLDIETDPLRPDTMYIASQSGRVGLSVMRSEDLGETWYSIHNDLDSGLVSWDLKVDPVDSDILYLAGSRDPLTAPGICLEKTTDGGNHWFDITPNDLYLYHVRSITISPFDHQTIFACTRTDGVLKSTNGRVTWDRISEGIDNKTVSEIVIDPETGYLYLGTVYQGIFRSTDGGTNWQNISQNINQAECQDIAINWRNPDTVFVATRGGIYQSYNGTMTWKKLELNSPYFYTETDGVIIDPYDPDYIYISYFDVAGIGEGGIFRSSDGGDSWQRFASGLPPSGYYRRIAVANYGEGVRRIYIAGYGIYYSDNLGENWQICDSSLPADYYYQIVQVSAVDPDLVYSANTSRRTLIYRSTDGGEIWESIFAPPGAQSLTSITCDPVERDIVYACRRIEGVFKSSDCGENWVNISNDLPRDPAFFMVSGVAINPLNPQTLYICSNNRGIFVSNNGGQNWEDFNEGLDTHFYQSITVIPRSDTNRIYIATAPKSVWSYTKTETSIEDDGISPPRNFISLSAYPNPFNATAIINFKFSDAGNVKLDIYDLLGRHMETIFDGIQKAGGHSIAWDASAYPSGVYFARLEVGERSESIKMVLLK